jgi:hypothetical protein
LDNKGIHTCDTPHTNSSLTIRYEPQGWDREGLSQYHFIYCAPQEPDGAPHDCWGCEFIPVSSGGGLGLAYSAKITHPSRNCKTKTKNWTCQCQEHMRRERTAYQGALRHGYTKNKTKTNFDLLLSNNFHRLGQK